MEGQDVAAAAGPSTTNDPSPTDRELDVGPMAVDGDSVKASWGFGDVVVKVFVDGQEVNEMQENVLCLLGPDGKPKHKITGNILTLLTSRAERIRRDIARLTLDASIAGYQYEFVLVEIRPKHVRTQQGGVAGTGRILKPFRYFTGGLEKIPRVLKYSGFFVGALFCSIKERFYSAQLEQVRLAVPALKNTLLCDRCLLAGFATTFIPEYSFFPHNRGLWRRSGQRRRPGRR